MGAKESLDVPSAHALQAIYDSRSRSAYPVGGTTSRQCSLLPGASSRSAHGPRLICGSSGIDAQFRSCLSQPKKRGLVFDFKLFLETVFFGYALNGWSEIIPIYICPDSVN